MSSVVMNVMRCYHGLMDTTDPNSPQGTIYTNIINNIMHHSIIDIIALAEDFKIRLDLHSGLSIMVF